MKFPLSLILISGLFVTGCGEGSSVQSKAPTTQPTVRAVEVAEIRRGSLDRVVNITGTLYGDEEITISAKVPGRIVDVMADIGDRLSPNDALAQIDSVDYTLVVQQRELAVNEALAKLGLDEMPDEQFDIATVATVERARFQAANAQAKLDRARKLFEQKPPLMSEQDFADIETAYQVADRDQRVALLEARSLLAQARNLASQTEAARQRLDDTTIRTPKLPAASSAGATQPASALSQRYGVTERLISTGEYVREGDALFRLVADNPIKYRARVPERFVSQLVVGQTVWVTVEGRSERFEGKVSRINPAIDVASRSFEIEAIIPNGDGQLRAGAFGRGSVQVGQDENVAFIPRSAIFTFAGLDRIYAIEDGKAKRFDITVRSHGDDYVALNEPLVDAKNVIVSDVAQLVDGAPVEAK